MHCGRYIPVHENIEAELLAAINLPGMQHVMTNVETRTAEGKTSASIDFIVAGKSLGVMLLICGDGSFVLVEVKHGQRYTRAWTAEEAQPEEITPAVVAAIWARVTALTGTM